MSTMNWVRGEVRPGRPINSPIQGHAVVKIMLGRVAFRAPLYLVVWVLVLYRFMLVEC